MGLKSLQLVPVASVCGNFFISKKAVQNLQVFLGFFFCEGKTINMREKRPTCRLQRLLGAKSWLLDGIMIDSCSAFLFI